jgi:serine/threonine protein kinase
MELCDMNMDEYIHGKSVPMLMAWDEAIKKHWGIFVIYRIMDHVLNGLAYIHGHDEVHRDITPPNRKYLERN